MLYTLLCILTLWNIFGTMFFLYMGDVTAKKKMWILILISGPTAALIALIYFICVKLNVENKILKFIEYLQEE